MGQLEQVNWYLDYAICVSAINNRNGTFTITVTAPEHYEIYNQEYDDEVNFIADLRSIRSKFATIDAYFKELKGE